MSDLPRGTIRTTIDDFVVEELPAYTPSGSGEHVFVRFTKRNVTTLDAAKALSRALGCDPREAGFAGMKDKRAVTTQTVSLHAPRGVGAADVAQRALSAACDGIVVHEATPHGNKLKPGHLAGNRFAITVRGIARDRMGEVVSALERVGRTGIPNAFGSQRFGADGDNVARALAWLRGEEPGPRDPRVMRMLWSSLQSEVFNAVLDARVRDATWTTALEGDLMKLHTSGGLFVCTAVQTDRERAERGEVSPTGPMIGAKMRWPEGEPCALEKKIAAEVLGEDFDLERTRRLGEGSRRALRMWVDGLRWEVDEERGHELASMRVYFVLPKGGYATTVLGAALSIDETTPARPASVSNQNDKEKE
ncbi:MAG TPA: tRNA pseudouridine(13) synthase TruD [Polyangiaceae bacterium]|jgi:tRNA pseudouridine13 synthase